MVHYFGAIDYRRKDKKNSVVNDHAVFVLGLVLLVGLVRLVFLAYFTSAPLAL